MRARFPLYALLAGIAITSAASDPLCPPTNDPENVIHYPHPTDCSKFLTCSWGNLIEQKCPQGHHWNDEQKYCDYPESANCQLEGSSTEAPQTPTWPPTGAESTTTTERPFTTTRTTTERPTTSEPAGKCPESYDPDNQVFFPHVDCGKYYVCRWDGVPIEMNCPVGLHWSQSKSQCDYPAQAGCDSSSLVNSFRRI